MDRLVAVLIEISSPSAGEHSHRLLWVFHRPHRELNYQLCCPLSISDISCYHSSCLINRH